MKTLQHKFVDLIPDNLEDGILYISFQYCTAVHKCICGCGNEVVTPISPVDWQITFDGESISLTPSIGNWNFDCKSHYYISNNKVIYARMWSSKEIKAGRKIDEKKKKRFFFKKRRN